VVERWSELELIVENIGMALLRPLKRSLDISTIPSWILMLVREKSSIAFDLTFYCRPKIGIRPSYLFLSKLLAPLRISANHVN